jgi:hypothetical protein
VNSTARRGEDMPSRCSDEFVAGAGSVDADAYARCVTGMENVWIARMDVTLRPPDGWPDCAPEGHSESRGPSAATC